MEKRDVLKDQIEQMGKVLARILSDLMGLKLEGETSQGVELAQDQLQSELDIEMDSLMNLTKKELKDYLENRLFTAGHLETLSECLTEMGKAEIERNKKDAEIKFEKAIELLDIADEISQAASFDRIDQKNVIENLLIQIK